MVKYVHILRNPLDYNIMDSDQLLQNADLLWQDLQKTEEKLEAADVAPLEAARQLLAATDVAFRTLKEWVINHHFDSCVAEIYFFKSVKPKFAGKLMCLRRMIAVLCSVPAAGIKNRRRHYQKEFESHLTFAANHADFIQYYRRSATGMDERYFIRYRYDSETAVVDTFYSFDERFATSHDHLVATILANDEYELFLKKQLQSLQESVVLKHISEEHLSWTASKAALTELIFALHHSRALNSGTADLSQTVRWFEQHFNISLGNYHKTMAEINLRKSHRTKFLQHLTENLHTYLDHLNA